MSAEELLIKSGDLSIHQLGAYLTLVAVRKIILSQKPKYLAEKLKEVELGGLRSSTKIVIEKADLGISREGFLFRGASLYNLLPANLKKETNIIKFKFAAKDWVRKNISVKA